MKSSRIVAGLLAILVISALLASCRGGNTTSNTTTAVTSEPVTGGIYRLSYRYEEGKFSLIDVQARGGYATKSRHCEVGYKCELLSSRGEVLDSFKFELPLEVHYDYPDPKTGQLSGGVFELKTVDDTLEVPYFSNGATINIYDPNGTRVVSVDVRKLVFKSTLQADVWTDKGGKGHGVPGGVYHIGEPISFYMSVTEDSTVQYSIHKPDGWVFFHSAGSKYLSAGMHSTTEIPGTTYITEIPGTTYDRVVEPLGNWKIVLYARTDKETVEDACQFEVVP